MAGPRLVIDGNNSRAAIMTNADPGDSAANISDPSFVNPLAHFGDWKWAGHPDVDYLGIVSVKSGSVKFDALSGGWIGVDYSTDTNGKKHYYTHRKVLFAHGMSYTPVLVGYLTVSGHNLPLCGDSYVNITTGFAASQGYKKFNVYADATNVYIYAEINDAVANPGLAAFPYTVYVCNMGIASNGSLVRPPLNSGFEASGSRLRCGRFDTNYGYFYKNASGSIPIYRGRSIDIGIGRDPSNSSIHALGFSYNVNGYSLTKYATSATTDDIGWQWPGTDKSAAALLKMSAALPETAPAFDASAGRIKFGNVLDTDQNMFLISNAILNKTITVPSKHVDSLMSYTDDTLTYNLGNVHANATDVIGLYTVDGKTRSIGGTHIIYSEGFPMRASRYQEQSGQTVAGAAMMFFYISVTGGQLALTVKRKVPRLVSSSRTIRSLTVTVNALVGAFDY